MSRPGTDRLKFNPPLGTLPALQYLLPEQMQIDAAYQRSLDSEASQTLVRRIAQHWNWDLCQPLVVARRSDGKLYVIDGQHRLAAARLRGDLAQLPAQVVHYESVQDEAASFVLLNQQRKPLNKLDLFKAAVVSGDSTATAIVEAMEQAGLRLAPHSNCTAWKPGMVSNIGGIEACWRGRGAAVTRLALRALAQGFKGEVLRYAGTIFPGVAALVDLEAGQAAGKIETEIWDLMIELLGSKNQTEWRNAIMRARGIDPNLKFASASAQVFLTAWKAHLDEIFDGDLPFTLPTKAAVDTGTPEEVSAGAARDAKEADEVSADHPGEGDLGEDPIEHELAGKDWEDAHGLPAAAVVPAAAPRAKARPAPRPAPPPSKPKTAPAIDWSKFKVGTTPGGQSKIWCKQCDRGRTAGEIAGCRDDFCSLRPKSLGAVL